MVSARFKKKTHCWCEGTTPQVSFDDRRLEVVLRSLWPTFQGHTLREGASAGGGTSAHLDLQFFRSYFAFAILTNDQGKLLRRECEGDIFAFAGLQGHASKTHQGLTRRGQKRRLFITHLIRRG